MPNSPKKKSTTLLSRTRNSWIWRYFELKELEVAEDNENVEQEHEKKEKVMVIVCQYRETPTSSPCGKTYLRKGSSTGNAISHLRSKHDICKVCET
jgi:hypothetical protein